jgi:hypothetical protein
LTFGGPGDSAAVITVPDGLKFVVTYMRVDTSAATNLIFKSGTTALTGAMRFATAGSQTLSGGGEAVIRGRAGAQRNLIINSSQACDVDGWVTYYLIAADRDYA